MKINNLKLLAATTIISLSLAALATFQNCAQDFNQGGASSKQTKQITVDASKSLGEMSEVFKGENARDSLASWKNCL
ncbi:MAG: hypothetical protein A2Z20_01625 [Bdellovibrionales bacterium RBG_16_40_8]|nr:MAG: hypothetical protein A2Z20_01625 [Bdellovibrionales bacterium RBG_16_40_8]